MSHRDIWEPESWSSNLAASQQIRASAFGPLAHVKFCESPHYESGIGLQAPDPASFFQAALRVDEGTSWTIRASPGQPPLHETTAGTTPLRGCVDAWDWSLTDAVGQSMLQWDGVRLPVLVLDRKMPGPDRVQQLEELLVSVWLRHHALLRRMPRPTTIQLNDEGFKARAPIHTLMLLERLLWHDGVHEAWEAIAAEPPTTLEIDWPRVRFERARRPAFHGNRAPWLLDGGWLPGQPEGRVCDREPTRTPDTPPNRLAVRLAMTVERLTDEVLNALHRSHHASALSWQIVARRARARATRLRATPALTTVDPYGALGLDTPTVQLSPVARPLLRAWSTLQRGLAMDARIESLLTDPLKEAWDLYEYWCWFELCEAVAHALGTPGRVARATDPGDPLIGEHVLRRGLVHTFCDANRVVRVYYNRTASGVPRDPYWSYSRGFRPDLAIGISDHHDSLHDLILLDAKYRVDVIEVQQDVQDAEKREERSGFAKTDDLKMMHGYRDALRTAAGHPPRWVLTLYPGTAVQLYPVTGKRTDALDALSPSLEGGIGAIPCSPLTGSHCPLRQAIRHLLGVPSAPVV